MTNWKLPSHLEPYRELIINKCGFDENLTLENLMVGYPRSWIKQEEVERIITQVDLLQRLYDAGKLK